LYSQTDLLCHHAFSFGNTTVLKNQRIGLCIGKIGIGGGEMVMKPNYLNRAGLAAFGKHKLLTARTWMDNRGFHECTSEFKLHLAFPSASGEQTKV
jgi:hypothetical protein